MTATMTMTVTKKIRYNAPPLDREGQENLKYFWQIMASGQNISFRKDRFPESDKCISQTSKNQERRYIKLTMRQKKVL